MKAKSAIITTLLCLVVSVCHAAPTASIRSLGPSTRTGKLMGSIHVSGNGNVVVGSVQTNGDQYIPFK